MKIIRRIALSLVALFLLWFFLIGPNSYYCYKCGAIKDNFFFVRQRPISKFVEEVQGMPCSHKWIIQTFGTSFFHLDYFADQKIPLLQSHYNILPAFEDMPHESWRKSLLEALTDEKNKLRWLVSMALNNTGYEIMEHEATIDWAAWENEFQDLFQPIYDLEQANAISAELVEKLKDEQGRFTGGFFTSMSYSNLQSDLKGDSK